MRSGGGPLGRAGRRHEQAWPGQGFEAAATGKSFWASIRAMWISCRAKPHLVCSKKEAETKTDGTKEGEEKGKRSSKKEAADRSVVVKLIPRVRVRVSPRVRVLLGLGLGLGLLSQSLQKTNY